MAGLSLLVLLLAAMACTIQAEDAYEKPRYPGYRYNGRFNGKCGEDGFYYRDSQTFVVCFNYFPYQLPCAQGAENSPDDRYVKGQPYGYRDFCDVHVDPQHQGYGEQPKMESVEEEDGAGYAGYGYQEMKEEKKKEEQPPPRQNIYNGYYSGSCYDDGFYYLDSSSFVVCSNKVSFILPCAPGSENSAFHNYRTGDPYAYRDFCDVNLVDDGYTAKHAAQSESDEGYGRMQDDIHEGYADMSESKSMEGYGTKSNGQSSEGYAKPSDSKSSDGYGASGSRRPPLHPRPPHFGPLYGGYYGYGFPPVFGYGMYGYGYGHPHGRFPSRGHIMETEGYGDDQDSVEDDAGYGYDAYEPVTGYGESEEEEPHGYSEEEEEKPNPESFTYRGHFYDKCGDDGFYYIDSHFFIICSNGHPFKLPCSPGTRNSPYTEFTEGGNYSYRDFCDINSLAEGYGSVKKETVHREKSKEKSVYKPSKEEDRKESAYPPKETGYGKSSKKPPQLTPKFIFNGFYNGECNEDGFYYRSLYSFVVCINGIDHRLPCAPGSRNRPYTTFMTGSPSSFRHFCDVNLVAGGLRDPREKRFYN